VDLRKPKSAVTELGVHWFALHVYARKEALVASQLIGQGLECFLPMYKSVRQWSDRLKEVQQPLFPSYLFCRFDYQDRRAVVTTSGVLQIVGNGRAAIPVADEEISAIQTAVASKLCQHPWPYIEVGERVRINWGSLRGLEGILINFRGSHRVVLSISLLQRSVAVEVDLAWVSAVDKLKHQSAAKEIVEKAIRIPVTS
jgi:transcription antitermination factor NusG